MSEVSGVSVDVGVRVRDAHAAVGAAHLPALAVIDGARNRRGKGQVRDAVQRSLLDRPAAGMSARV